MCFYCLELVYVVEEKLREKKKNMREVANFTFNRSKRYRYQKLAKLVNYFYKMDQCESN